MSDQRPGHEELRRRLDRLASDAPGPTDGRDQTVSRARHRARLGMTAVGVGAVVATLATLFAVGAIRDLDRGAPVALPSGSVGPRPGASNRPKPPIHGQIAYWSGTEPTEGSIERAQLVVAPADGSRPQNVGPGEVSTSRLSWSPDGAHVVFDRRTGPDVGELDTMTVPAGVPTTLLDVGHAPQDPDWSSNGTIVFATDSRAMFTMQPSDLPPQSTPIRRLGPNRFLEGLWPTWSPEGDRVAFTDPDTGTLNVVDVDGRSAPRIVLGRRTDSLDWGPDGIVASAREGAGWNLYLVDPTGNRPPERLTDEAGNEIQPSISEDGRFVAFVGSEGGQRDVYVLDLLDESIDQITDDSRLEFSPAWRPSSS